MSSESTTSSKGTKAATTRRRKAATASTNHHCARPKCDTIGAERYEQLVPIQGVRNPKSVVYYLCRDDSRSPLARSQAQKAVRDQVRAGTWS